MQYCNQGIAVFGQLMYTGNSILGILYIEKQLLSVFHFIVGNKIDHLHNREVKVFCRFAP